MTTVEMFKVFTPNITNSPHFPANAQDPSGLFSGKCALLLCRVVCGELFRTEESDVSTVRTALATGRGDSGRWPTGFQHQDELFHTKYTL